MPGAWRLNSQSETLPSTFATVAKAETPRRGALAADAVWSCGDESCNISLGNSYDYAAKAYTSDCGLKRIGGLPHSGASLAPAVGSG